MQDDKMIVTRFVLVALAMSLAGVGGCSESEQRQAGRELLEQTDRAGRLCSTAADLLAGPSYQDGDLEVPGGEAVAAQPARTVSPEATAALDRAEEILSKALAAPQAKEAEGQDRAIAYAMLGRVLSLKAHCESLAAAGMTGRADIARDRVVSALTSAQLRLDLLSQYKNSRALSDDGLSQERARIEAEQKGVARELDGTEVRIEALAKAKTTQEHKYETLNSQARMLAIEARLGSSREGLAKLEEAISVQAGANAAESAIARIEYEVSSLAVRRKSLVLDLANATARLNAIIAISEERRAHRDRDSLTAQTIENHIQADLRDIAKFIETIASACEELVDAHAKATSLYDLALRQLSKANKDGGDTAALEANILMAMADMQARSLRTLAANARFAEPLAAVWSAAEADALPPAAKKAQSFLPDPAEVKADAEGKYRKAISLFEKSSRGVDRNLLWAYLGQEAIAHARLYGLTGDAADLAAAREVLDKVLADSRYSPNVVSLVQLEGMLESQAIE